MSQSSVKIKLIETLANLLLVMVDQAIPIIEEDIEQALNSIAKANDDVMPIVEHQELQQELERMTKLAGLLPEFIPTEEKQEREHQVRWTRLEKNRQRVLNVLENSNLQRRMYYVGKKHAENDWLLESLTVYETSEHAKANAYGYQIVLARTPEEAMALFWFEVQEDLYTKHLDI